MKMRSLSDIEKMGYGDVCSNAISYSNNMGMDFYLDFELSGQLKILRHVRSVGDIGQASSGSLAGTQAEGLEDIVRIANNLRQKLS